MKSQPHIRITYYMFVIPALLVIFVSILMFIQQTDAASENNTFMPLVHNCPSPIYPLINGGFEMGNIGWIFSWDNADITSGEFGITPHDGNLMAVIESNALIPGFPTGTIEQSFTVPACSPYLSFWWSAYITCNILNPPPCDGRLELSVNGIEAASYWSQDGTKPWELMIVDLSAYRGSTISLQFSAYSGRDFISAYIDDLAFQDHPGP